MSAPRSPASLDALGLSHQPRKRFGQNFLHDAGVIGQIVDAIAPNPDDLLLEIGPGMGALTEPLLDGVKRLTVVELDTDLADSLRIRIGANSHTGLTIVKANALQVDYRALYRDMAAAAGLEPTKQDKKLRVVGNLPYNISTPLLFYLIGFADVIDDMHFMLQKEVVERITAAPDSAEYGRLSVMMQYYCDTEYLLTVPNGAFRPAPKVTSAVFRLRPYRDKPLIARDEALFAHVVREAFNHRRKSLRAIFKKPANLPSVSETQLEQIGLAPMARPENLNVADFVQLSDAITELA
ncbi:16S rRNA (adenine(1518)-N(6)/adenine(1519)-N(6))-dimethyltransferase RsmA [Moraxella atlantae]|uniref:Ribosomal RNA small subunit methyltransferase A n=1 Tax=Faucicola atlantae TaxID=34059 RepID=A0A378Q4Q1_9GAMM|nr:16S rRNA (adenine(1518)-N(6)/adenine(1519)-N(6))-dimethyltransferase RsmA [Moraxella atlantae]OPH36988.1 16S rRNA (adenine(1518)-N(6)/adenine(1519)-N(6))-dimethyltransferase [Moraxella atlantae]STY95709.1 Ribosomal RNA small subunit methyltransferase A [Moraxella atlantae]